MQYSENKTLFLHLNHPQLHVNALILHLNLTLDIIPSINLIIYVNAFIFLKKGG